MNTKQHITFLISTIVMVIRRTCSMMITIVIQNNIQNYTYRHIELEHRGRITSPQSHCEAVRTGVELDA